MPPAKQQPQPLLGLCLGPAAREALSPWLRMVQSQVSLHPERKKS